MFREVQGRFRSANDSAGDRGHPPAALREAELPMREWGGLARAGALELFAGEQGAFGDASPRADRTGARRDGTLSPGPRENRRAGQRGARHAGGEPAVPSLSEADAFGASDALYDGLVGLLRGAEASGFTHDELETRLDVDGRELCRQLLQDHFDLRATRERRVGSVNDAQGVVHRAVESGHHRVLETIFGEVTIARLAYRAKGSENLHRQDAALNLPAGRHSYGLSERCAIEATRGSYEEAKAAIERSSGIALAKRQVESLARRAAIDVESFYDNVQRQPAGKTDTLVITCDGKGIVMRPDALRPGTKKAAAAGKHKLKTRLSKGEKKDRKRMAELAVVYDCSPVPRRATDILARAEALLQALGLEYRVLDLCTGDLGNSSSRTFDLEAYAPGCDQWLEVSSVSWFSDYQARRANVRFRPTQGGPPAFVHTLNGSALAWPRVWAALVEVHRQADGSVKVPECLRPWLRGQAFFLAP